MKADIKSGCKTCVRKSNHDRCSRVECPMRKQVMSQPYGRNIVFTDGAGRFATPTTRTDREYD